MAVGGICVAAHTRLRMVDQLLDWREEADNACIYSREKAIGQAMARHADELDDETRTFLLEKLRLPEKYLEESEENKQHK